MTPVYSIMILWSGLQLAHVVTEDLDAKRAGCVVGRGAEDLAGKGQVSVFFFVSKTLVAKRGQPDYA